MQSQQQHNLPLPQSTVIYPSYLDMDSVIPGHYPAHGANTIQGFSSGSSSYYQDHEHRHFFDRGGGASSSFPSSTSPLPSSPHATGLASSGNPTASFNNFYPEDIARYQLSYPHPVHGHLASITQAPLDIDFSLKSTRQAPVGNSSITSLSTLADMAIILGPTSGAVVPNARVRPPVEVSRNPPPAQEEEVGLSRERKHACTMCHKRSAILQVIGSIDDRSNLAFHRFDRPSTLRKVNVILTLQSDQHTDPLRLIASARPYWRKRLVPLCRHCRVASDYPVCSVPVRYLRQAIWGGVQPQSTRPTMHLETSPRRIRISLSRTH